MWKDFPSRLAEQTGSGVFAYSRHGYGQSARLTNKRDVDYMHYESDVISLSWESCRASMAPNQWRSWR
jgi:hypothetical protein